MNKFQENLKVVFDRILKEAEKDEDYAQAIAEEFDKALNDLQEYDFFGTEGQCDPRGDGREGLWQISGEIY